MEKLVFMPGLNCFRNVSRLFFAFGLIAGCCSASLKLRACDAAYPWSQSPSTDSQCRVCHQRSYPVQIIKMTNLNEVNVPFCPAHSSMANLIVAM